MLHRRGGHDTCTRRYCLSKDILSYDLRTLLFPPLVAGTGSEPADSGTAAPGRVGSKQAQDCFWIFVQGLIAP